MTAGLAADFSLRLGTLHLQAVLTAERGETVALVGPNGAGKTTLLRTLAGLARPDRGTVVLDGEVLVDASEGIHLEPERRPVGFVFQDHLLFPHLTVTENVAFGLRARGVSRGEARRRAGEWLAQVGLDAYASARPGVLSGGQAQRVALARALAVEPVLLLLDEPLAALDATTRAATRRDLRRHLAAHDGIRIVVTHDPVDAAALADRLVVLEEGVVVQTGTPAEISRRPRSRYVADLVGVNLLEGRAEGNEITLGGGFRLRAADASTGDVFAVVHPKAVSLHRGEPDTTARNAWPATVTSLDDEGGRVRVAVGGPVDVVAEVTPGAVADLGLAERGEVWVSVKATEVAVYPR